MIQPDEPGKKSGILCGMATHYHAYDIAVSFAGEQRPYVEEVVEECVLRGLSVFYDRHQAVELWGRNIIRRLREIYGQHQALYFVPFLSAEYLAKPYPMDEFITAMEHALERGEDYILPVIMGYLCVPSDLLNPAIGFIRSEDHSPGDLASVLVHRVTNARRNRRLPRDLVSLLADTSESRPGSTGPAATKDTGGSVEQRAVGFGNARIQQAGRDITNS